MHQKWAVFEGIKDAANDSQKIYLNLPKKYAILQIGILLFWTLVPLRSNST